MKKFIIALLICAMIVGVAFAQASKQTRALIIWSAAAEDEAQALVAKFNEKYPDIKVSVIRAGSGELLTRLNAEQPKPQGDILLGIAKESFDGAYDLFRAYKSVNHQLPGRGCERCRRDPEILRVLHAAASLHGQYQVAQGSGLPAQVDRIWSTRSTRARLSWPTRRSFGLRPAVYDL